MTKKCLGILDVDLYLEHAELEIFLSVEIGITGEVHVICG